VRRSPGRSIRLVVAVVLMPLEAASAAGPRPPGDPLAEGVRVLHQGLYGRAEEIFQTAARNTPQDPEPQLFIAFTRWWRLLLEDRHGGVEDAGFDAGIDSTVARGERILAAAPEDTRAMTAVGTAHILRSHVEAMRRNYFHAAQEARRGRKLLEAALKLDPAMQEALFPLGALNYYADRVPALVKGLRTLLFLPGGDADRGLEQLQAVATSGTRFRTDAQLLIALICGSRDEACYRGALQRLRGALAENPGSPLILGLLGEVQMQLGTYDEAIQSFEEALAGAVGDDPDRSRQRRALRIALAEALVADWRLDHASELLHEVDLDRGPAPQGALRARARTEQELLMKRSKAPLSTEDGAVHGGAEALAGALKAQEQGRLKEALALASDAVAARPDLVIARFLKGRILFLCGQFAQADSELAGVEERVTDPPAWLKGWTDLYRGIAESRLGNRRGARSHLRHASDVRRFRSGERGILELQWGELPNPRCAM